MNKLLYSRDEGVIFTITLWQWCLEAIFNLTIFIFQFFFKEKSRMVDHTFLLMSIFMSCIVLPSFYFTSGRAFRRVLKTEGFVRTMWKAYTHNLNWELRLKLDGWRTKFEVSRNANWRLKYENWSIKTEVEGWSMKTELWRLKFRECKMKNEH